MIIRDPKEVMTVEERADQMWSVHPFDLDRLYPASDGHARVSFFKDHINAAIAQAEVEKAANAECATESEDYVEVCLKCGASETNGKRCGNDRTFR